MKMNGLDIHDYSKRLESGVRRVENAPISSKNKKLIFKFQEQCVIQDLSKPRIIKYLEILVLIAKDMKKDFDKADIDDIKGFVKRIQEKDYSPWTKHSYKVIIKRFYKWLKGNDEEYPREVKWIKCNVKRKEQNLPGDGDLLDEEDIKNLIKTAEHPRDKALISVLFESGCRIGEIGTLNIGSINFDKQGTVICVNGKTGPRKIRLISSAPYLANWLGCHPSRDDKEAPLWVTIGQRNYLKQMRYNTIRSLLGRLFKKAKIKKRYNPHLFRHSRATFLANHLTEFQMNQYFGWIQGSDMPSTYVHLSGKEVDNALLELNGFETKQKSPKSILKPKKCPRCDTLNNAESKFCGKCGGVADIETAMQIEEKRIKETEMRKDSDNIMNALINDPEMQRLISKKLEELKIAQQ